VQGLLVAGIATSAVPLLPGLGRKIEIIGFSSLLIPKKIGFCSFKTGTLVCKVFN
jgi:hypothetical protein